MQCNTNKVNELFENATAVICTVKKCGRIEKLSVPYHCLNSGYFVDQCSLKCDRQEVIRRLSNFRDN